MGLHIKKNLTDALWRFRFGGQRDSRAECSFGPFGTEALTAKMVSFLILGESTKRPSFDVELHDGKSSARFNIH